MKNSNNLRNMIAIAIFLAATTICANAQTAAQPAQSPYIRILDVIAKAKQENDYDKKVQLYSQAVGGVGFALRRKEISCNDPEMPQIDADIMALEKEMNEMYNALVQANKKPEHSPVKYVPCEQDAAHWANYLKGEPMPPTYQQSAEIQQKVEELNKYHRYSEFYQSVGTFVKIVFLTQDWEEVIGKENTYPFKVLTHYRMLSVGMLVKVAGEETHRLYYTYKLTQIYNLNGGLTDVYEFTDAGGKGLFKRVQYKP